MKNNYYEYRECTIRQLLEKTFGYTSSEICDDTTKIISPCGCIVYHTHDDTPGFRENNYTINCLNCLLNHYNNNNH